MTPTDYLIDILLIAVVVRQMRTRELTLRSMVLPLWLVAVAAISYLRPVPVSEPNLCLVSGLVGIGVVVGVLSGVATQVWKTSDGGIYARAGLLAASFWVAGMTARFIFAVYATHSGQGTIERFSVQHGITGIHIWPVALVLMAFGEVLARTAVLQLRRMRNLHTAVDVVPTAGPAVQQPAA